MGRRIVKFLWGGRRVCGATLRRFFGLHFIMPFILLVLMLVHLSLLHKTGSRNPLGVDRRCDKVPFYPYYVYKDLLGIWLFMGVFVTICFVFSDMFSDPQNFIVANPIKTPAHIKPEWYFLFAYAILRSIPNKTGGVVAMAGAIVILYLLPFIS